MNRLDELEILAGRLDLATRAGRVAVWEWDLRTDDLYWSPIFMEIIGIEPDEFSGTFSDFIDRIVPEDKERVERALDAHFKQATPYDIEFEMFRKDGRRIVILAQGQVTPRADGSAEKMVGTVHDVTEERRLEERLLEAERIANIGHWEVDLIGNALRWSPETFRIHGLDPKGPPPTLEEAFAFYHPDDADRVVQQFNEVMADGRFRELDARLVLRNGDIRFVHVDGVARLTADGTPERLFGIVQDRTEATAKEQQLRQSQNLEALGQLVGGIAHDFNNTLAVLKGNLDLLRLIDDEDEVETCFSELENAVERGSRLTMQLLAYGRKAILTPKVQNLSSVVSNVDRMIRRVLPETIQIETVAGGGLWNTRIDSAQVENALLNLALNARDAMPEGGKLTIETSNIRIDDAYIEDRVEDLAPGRFVMLAVTDTGVGMPGDALARAFDPFFTTKSIDKGSGMGLSMVHGLMKQIGGTARLYSEVGVGTTVKLYFPASFEDAESDRPSPSRPIHRGAAHLLLAEDDPGVRDMLERQLLALGYQVTVAENGDLALEALLADSSIEMLVTDIVMPGSLQGPMLAKRAREHRPNLPVLFMSGYPREASIHGNGLRLDDINLMKPVGIAELAHAIDKTLGRET